MDQKRKTANINGQGRSLSPLKNQREQKRTWFPPTTTFGILNLIIPPRPGRSRLGPIINDSVTIEHISCVFLTPKGFNIHSDSFIKFQRNQIEEKKREGNTCTVCLEHRNI